MVAAASAYGSVDGVGQQPSRASSSQSGAWGLNPQAGSSARLPLPPRPSLSNNAASHAAASASYHGHAPWQTNQEGLRSSSSQALPSSLPYPAPGSAAQQPPILGWMPMAAAEGSGDDGSSSAATAAAAGLRTGLTKSSASLDLPGRWAQLRARGSTITVPQQRLQTPTAGQVYFPPGGPSDPGLPPARSWGGSPFGLGGSGGLVPPRSARQRRTSLHASAPTPPHAHAHAHAQPSANSFAYGSAPSSPTVAAARARRASTASALGPAPQGQPHWMLGEHSPQRSGGTESACKDGLERLLKADM